jgi:hypothetical protein
MRKFISSLLVMMSIFMMTATFSSCGDDDEVISGAEQVARLEKVLEDYPLSVLDDDDYSLYYYVADDEADAMDICNDVLGQTWNGKATTVTLNDNCGTISIIPGTEDGYYAQISLDVTGEIGEYRIRVVSQAYYNAHDNRTN